MHCNPTSVSRRSAVRGGRSPPGERSGGHPPFPWTHFHVCVLKQRALAFWKNENYHRRHQSSEIIVKMLAVHTRTIIGHYKQMVFIHTEMFPCSLPVPGKAVCAPSGLFFSSGLFPGGQALCLLPVWGCSSSGLCVCGMPVVCWGGVPPLFVGLGSKMALTAHLNESTACPLAPSPSPVQTQTHWWGTEARADPGSGGAGRPLKASQ